MNVCQGDLSKIITKVLEQAQELRKITDIQANIDITLIYIKIENTQKRIQQKYPQQKSFKVLFLELDHLQKDFQTQQELYYQQIQKRQSFHQISPAVQVNFSDFFSCLSNRRKKRFDYTLLTDFLLNNFEDYYQYNLKYFPEKCNKILIMLKSNKHIKKEDQFKVFLLNDIDRILALSDQDIQIYISHFKLLSQFHNQINNFPVLKSQIYDCLYQVQKNLQINEKLLNLDYIFSRIMKDIVLKTVKSDFRNKEIAGDFLREHKNKINDIVFAQLKGEIVNL